MPYVQAGQSQHLCPFVSMGRYVLTPVSLIVAFLRLLSVLLPCPVIGLRNRTDSAIQISQGTEMKIELHKTDGWQVDRQTSVVVVGYRQPSSTTHHTSVSILRNKMIVLFKGGDRTRSITQ